MNSEEITFSESGKHYVKESIFVSNSGITHNKESSQLFVSSCLFHGCSKKSGGSIVSLTSNGRNEIEKTCGCYSFLTAENQCGQFCRTAGATNFYLVSYYGADQETSRDTFCHDHYS